MQIREEFNMNVPILDDNITFAEIDLAINEIGICTGIDGLNSNVTKLFTQKLKLLLMNFLNKIYDNSYPDIWKEQLLFSIKKKGHKKDDPKLCGCSFFNP